MTILNNLNDNLYDLQYFLEKLSWAMLNNKIDNICDVNCLCYTKIVHEVCDKPKSVYIDTDMNFEIFDRTVGETVCKIYSYSLGWIWSLICPNTLSDSCIHCINVYSDQQRSDRFSK
jgi:hypothetical protein